MSTAVHSAPTIHEVQSRRSSQIVAFAAAALFFLGFFSSPIGNWTGPILAG